MAPRTNKRTCPVRDLQVTGQPLVARHLETTDWETSLCHDASHASPTAIGHLSQPTNSPSGASAWTAACASTAKMSGSQTMQRQSGQTGIRNAQTNTALAASRINIQGRHRSDPDLAGDFPMTNILPFVDPATHHADDDSDTGVLTMAALTAELDTRLTSRAAWLAAFLKLSRQAFAYHDFAIPQTVRLGVGAMPRTTVLGVCYAPSVTTDYGTEITLSFGLDCTTLVAGVATHELVHSCMFDAGHGKRFAAACRTLGLTGKPTSAGLKLDDPAPEWLARILRQIGSYPSGRADIGIQEVAHGAPRDTGGPAGEQESPRKKGGRPKDNSDRPVGGPAKQTTRLRKASCTQCDMTFRITRKWIDNNHGVLRCPSPACDPDVALELE